MRVDFRMTLRIERRQPPTPPEHRDTDAYIEALPVGFTLEQPETTANA